ncbi:hypothetical protein N7G274_010912 [Stereocaulon virgatum]|uniref:Uncharacterized protein n=1 Tax=Stereocaulon virgatum TaxID=373712 RepID=A0ABR3ZTN0_9LECA
MLIFSYLQGTNVYHAGRLVRLIPHTHTNILNLFNHRLPASTELADAEFLTLLTGTSPLYASIETPQAMLIRSILSHLHLEILKRSRPPTSTFNFQSASIGNLFVTGARLFSGAFESAIYLLAIMGGVDESTTAVLPAIVSNFSHHISAGLADGTIIAGQNAISHPSEPTALNNADGGQAGHGTMIVNGFNPTIEDATLPGSLPTLKKSAIAFSKECEESLSARIERVWYINPYGQEMRPAPNPKVLEAVSTAEAVMYSIGSLYTSIIPSIILQGVGEAIARSGGARFKILILNGSLDRETGGFSALDFVAAIARAGEESRGRTFQSSKSVDGRLWSMYVTHLIHLEGEGVPKVDKKELARWGVECVRLYGRKSPEGEARYDGQALVQALSAILGKRERGERSRRNTLEN